MQLEREKHEREMVDTKRHNEMLEVGKVGADWGKKGALIGAGGGVIAAGSLAVAALDICSVMWATKPTIELRVLEASHFMGKQEVDTKIHSFLDYTAHMLFYREAFR